MKKTSLFNKALVITAFFFAIPNMAFDAQEKRTALVIGNGSYQSSPLKNPLNDATDMASVLNRLGFEVTLKTNANQRMMEESIRAFGNKLRSGGVGLFYYAGHGIQYRGRNYLIPIQAAIKSEADIKYESVDAGRVLAQMEEAGNNLNIIILDACRNNPYSRSFRSSERGLAKMDAPTGSILAYATSPGSVAADGIGRNGLYTSKLLKHMVTPGLTIERVFKNVRIEVMNNSGKNQVPWESSSLTGDFYFNLDRGVSVTEVPPLVASILPTEKASKEVKRDDRYIKYDNGVVFDRETGLEWFAQSKQNTTWKESRSWVEGLRIGGGGWRMPTNDELIALYASGKGKFNSSDLLGIVTIRVWSGDTEKTSGSFCFGSSDHTVGVDDPCYSNSYITSLFGDITTECALAVRLRK